MTILPDGGVRVVDDGRGIPVDEVPGEGVSGVETVMPSCMPAASSVAAAMRFPAVCTAWASPW